MASKKPVSKKPMSAAFIEKAKKEKEKLQNVLATQLHADMSRMFKEGEFSDLTLSCGLDKFAVHIPLIQARLPDLYAACVKLAGPMNGTEEQEVNVGKLGLKPEDAKKLLEFLLCNRSNYFAAMLGGGWRESNSAEITLEGASYSAVIAALCFIYGATPELPADVNIREIVYLADMYCLEGLKEVTALKLRQDNCHFFHKPCNGCLAGAPEAIMLSHGYRITDLYECTVRWALKHIDRTWSQRNFAAMPSEVIHQCSEFAVTDLSCETAITMTIQVDKLVQSLPNVKWSDPVRREADWLLDACIQYVAMNFLAMIGQSSFEKLLVGLGWNKGLLESLFHRIVCNLSEETAVPAYLAVNGLRLRASLDDWNMDALELVNKLISMCHSYMVKNVNYLMRAPSWARIPEELQKKIKDDAVFVDDEKRALAPKPKLSSAQKSNIRPASAKPSVRGDSGRTTSARGASASSARPTSARGASGSSTSRSSATGSSSGQRSTSRQSTKPAGNWKP